MSQEPAQFVPRLIALEITRRCDLRCKHCRAAAEQTAYDGELTVEEIGRIAGNIAADFSPVMIVTGGEPTARADLFEIIRLIHETGLRTVMATCATTLTEQAARRLKEAGIQRISVSIDGPTAEAHDDFRGVPGAFEAATAGLAAARQAGLPFQINTTITTQNMGHLATIHALAVSLGAVAFHPFMLVPIGRARDLTGELLTAEDYERVLTTIHDLQQKSPIPLKPTCAPHYHRILRQRAGPAADTTGCTAHGLDTMTKGCMGGVNFAFISHVGRVQICGFLEESAGDLRENDYNFAQIWTNSELFHKLRDFRNYKGRCGVCEFKRWCGGCRARAYAATGDYLDEEPFCSYVPRAHS